VLTITQIVLRSFPLVKIVACSYVNFATGKRRMCGHSNGTINKTLIQTTFLASLLIIANCWQDNSNEFICGGLKLASRNVTFQLMPNFILDGNRKKV
jgi:hypothetical protein